jgi:hypothetical protein
MVFFHENGERHTFEGQPVTRLDRIVFRGVLLAKIPGNKLRSEIAEELRANLENFAEEARSYGYDEEASARMVKRRFGEPQKIASAFASEVVQFLERLDFSESFA